MFLLASVNFAVAGVCAPDALKKGTDALGMLSDASLRPMLAAAALQEACQFDAPVEKALGNWQGTSPDQARMIDMQVATLAIDGWMAACPAGPGVLATAISLAPSEQRGFLWDQCGLEQLGVLGDRAAFVRAKGAMVMPIVIAGKLGSERAAAGALLRALAGE